MDVDAVGERLAELRDARDMRQHAQLDLAVVGRDQHVARLGDEGRPDLAALRRPDRDVLQVRLRRRKPPRGGRRERIGGVDAPGLGMDIAGQGVRIGRFQLRHLPPVDDLARQLVTLGGQILQHLRRGRPLAGLGLRAAGQTHAPEQDVTQLLRRTDREGAAGELVDLVLEPRGGLCEIARQPAQDLPVDRNAALFHARQNLDQRPFEPFVDRDQPLRDQSRLQHTPQPQRNVRVFRRIGRGAVDIDHVEGDEALARSRDLLEGDRLVAEPLFRQRVHALAAGSGIGDVGQQHRVVERRGDDAAPEHHQPVIFHVVRDLEHGWMFEQRLQDVERVVLRYLPVDEPSAQKVAASRLVRQRHVACASGSRRQRETAQFGLHRVERRRLRVEGDKSRLDRLGDPVLERVDVPHGDILRRVDLLVHRCLRAAVGKCCGRVAGRRRVFAPALGRRLLLP